MYSYTTNLEYRQCIRQFFKMKTPDPDKLCEEYANIDEESLDELTYDAEAVENTMNEIYAKTKEHSAFKILYQEAAAKMISQDLETGLAILLSYDYFASFAELLKVFGENPASDLESTLEYKILYEKIK